MVMYDFRDGSARRLRFFFSRFDVGRTTMTGTGEFWRQYLETEPGRRPWIPPSDRPRVPTIRQAGS
jgi:hypothetical protein